MTRTPRFDCHFRAELGRLFRWRRDVRRFRPDAVPAELVDALVETASLAPSVGLSQPWRFVFVSDPARRAAIRASFARCNDDALRRERGERAELYARLKLEGLQEAPCQFALFADRETIQGHGLGRRTMPEAIDYSAVLSLHTLWLAATAAGLGLGWVSILDPADVIAALDVPDHWVLIGYFCLGYPAEDSDVPELERAGWEVRADTRSMVLQR